jgi:hypothetical protein
MCRLLLLLLLMMMMMMMSTPSGFDGSISVCQTSCMQQ